MHYQNIEKFKLNQKKIVVSVAIYEHLNYYDWMINSIKCL